VDTRTPSPSEVAKWERLGGVDLSRLEPEELVDAVDELGLGVYHTGNLFRFRCPVCGNVATNDQLMEPMCTGPRWTDDHPPEVMNYIQD
jgi:hypothetical protein